MPKVYGYTRASTGSQSLTFDVQQAAIKRYFKEKLEPIGYEWGDMFEDKAVSGGKPFTDRPEGRKLWVVCQPKDAVLWMKIDRAFRSVKDGANVLSLFRERGVSIHSIDIGLDTSTPMGEFTMHLLILLAQLERSWISSRTKEALAALKERGYKNLGNSIPAGFKRVGKPRGSALYPDPAERALIIEAYADYMEGDSLETVSNRLFFTGKRRHNGSEFKPAWLAYAFRCYRAGWPKSLRYFQYQAEVRAKLKGKRISRRALGELTRREFAAEERKAGLEGDH
jgi:putative DNA-invertase from lambdoid prophage Rac